MRRLLAGALCAALLGAAQAADAPAAIGAAAAPGEAQQKVIAGRSGYAHDQPEILLRQRLFGLAHGLSLLAAACLDLPAHSEPIQDAYAAWHAKQAKAIEAIVHDLAAYYFGPRAEAARWPDLSRALNLIDNIQPALNEVTLHAACASLPEAIARPRYALDKLLTGTVEPETLPDIVAVPPAPTLPAPAQ
ncbi:MAG: hypothetical protein NDI91_17120 [Sulfuritalea sp.]|nr:hypothetical protein [Sulfuritalea sp.]